MKIEFLRDFRGLVEDTSKNVRLRLQDSYEISKDDERVERFVTLFIKEIVFRDHSVRKVMKSIIDDLVEKAMGASLNTGTATQMQEIARELLFIIDTIYNTVLYMNSKEEEEEDGEEEEK